MSACVSLTPASWPASSIDLTKTVRPAMCPQSDADHNSLHNAPVAQGGLKLLRSSNELAEGLVLSFEVADPLLLPEHIERKLLDLFQ